MTPSDERILIVEDDARLAALLQEYLSSNGFEVAIESRGDRAVDRICKEEPALVVLDLMLPGCSGFEVCRLARQTYDKGLLILTASKAEVDHAVGLEIGADDYVVKPVEPRILLARIRSLLRRTRHTMAPVAPSELTVGPLNVSRFAREARVGASVLPLILSNFAGGSKNSCNSDINNLSDRELEIFSFIGRGVSVSELATELHVSVKTIETHQMRMKEKLALHTAAELRQKAREWLAKSAVNRIREDPEAAYASGRIGE